MVRIKLKAGAATGSAKDLKGVKFRGKEKPKPSKDKENNRKIHVDADGVKIGDKKVKHPGGTTPKRDKEPIKDKVKKNNQQHIEKVVNKTPEMPAWMDKHFNSDISKRIGTAAAVGAGVGLVTAAVNNEDDDMLSTGEKMVKYAALGVGASYGSELGLNKVGITSKHLARSDVAKTAKKVMTEAEEVSWQKNMLRKKHLATGIGLAAFGIATIMDATSGMSDNRKASVERNRQEQELAKRQSAEKQRQGQQGYGYVDYGQIVLEQWEKRIGHYAMGNARFN